MPHLLPLQKFRTELLPLAEEIENAWVKVDRDPNGFWQIVFEKTQTLDLGYLGHLTNIAVLLEEPSIGKLQHPSTFSDLYIKLYDNGHFWIEVLNWWGSDINIHDHDFSGVQFQLKGKSLNVVYQLEIDFEQQQIATGTLSIRRVELWEEGTRSIVRPGRIEPHNVSHLNVPTVSLLIRTHPNPKLSPQWNYLPPGIGADYSVATPLFRKKIAMLRLLAKGAVKDFHQAFASISARQTPPENLFLLTKMVDILYDSKHVALVEELARRSALERAIVISASYYRAQTFLSNTLKYVSGLTERQILALAILSSSHDADSFFLVARWLDPKSPSSLWEKCLTEILAQLTGSNKNFFSNILKLYGIGIPQGSLALNEICAD